MWITFFWLTPFTKLEIHFYGQSPTPSDKENCKRIDSAKMCKNTLMHCSLYWEISILNFCFNPFFFFKPSTTYCPLLSPHDHFIPCYHLAHFYDLLEMFSCLMVPVPSHLFFPGYLHFWDTDKTLLPQSPADTAASLHNTLQLYIPEVPKVHDTGY